MNTKIYVLHFPKETGDKPIICEMVKKFDIEFNILKATILPGNDGLMVLELTGHKKNVKKSLEFLQNYGVKIEPISTIIRRDDELCIQCGACTGVCPTSALVVENLRWQSSFFLINAQAAASVFLCARFGLWKLL